MSEIIAEAQLHKTLRAEAKLCKEVEAAAKLCAHADRRNLKCEIPLVVGIVILRSHVADVGTETEVGVKSEDAGAIVIILGIEHDNVVVNV